MKIALHDSSAMHLVTLESLQALGLNEPVEVTARRFRPNLVIETGLGAFEEDGWDGKIVAIRTWTMGRWEKVKYSVRKKTGRCDVPGINPLTGERDNAPMKFLSRNRRSGKDIFFGLYLYPMLSRGELSVGSSIKI
jgi:uncharacterized protein YcbX